MFAWNGVKCPKCKRPLPGDAVRCASCGAAAKPKRAPARRSPDEKVEHRPLAVLFCDLVDSVALSESLDPEELLAIMDDYHGRCAAIVAERGGFLANLMGDGVLAYFGYPHANEEDSANAVNAGIEVLAAVREMGAEKQLDLKARVGIATGLVLVKPPRRDHKGGNVEVVGRVPNLAARLQAAARPNAVLISDATRKVTRGSFLYRDLGLLTLKGFPRPVQAWEVKEADDAVSRFQARLLNRPTPFVGRQAEFARIEAAWDAARAGRGTMIEIVGEAGMGKSRLVDHFNETFAAQSDDRIFWNCAPERRYSAFYPVARVIQRIAALDPRETPARQLEKLERLVNQSSSPGSMTVALLAALLSLPWKGPSPLDGMTPEKQRELTLETLTSLILEGTAGHPTALIVEDAHWIDASTLELLTRLRDGLPGRSMLILVTARPDFRPSWRSDPRAEVIALSGLAPADSLEVCAHVGAGVLEPGIVADLVSRSDGNPLFVEELTRAVVESLGGQDLDAGQTTRIPISLYESLVARLDRLGAARRFIDIGAVIGRRFDFDLLTAVSESPTPSVRSAVGALKRSGLVSQLDSSRNGRYLFRHALVRDAAYETMVKSERRSLHDALASALEAKYPNIRETEPEVIAHHLAHGGQPHDAIPLWQKAGQKFAARGGHVEAIAHYRSALELLRQLPEGPARVQPELGCLVPLAASLAATQGYAADEVKDLLTRARELCAALGDAAPLFPILHGLSKFWTVRSDQVLAENYIRTCFKIAEEVGNPLYLVESAATLGYVLCTTGQFGNELAHLIGLGPRVYDENESACRENWSEANAKSSALSIAPMAYFLMGRSEDAERVYRDALAWARKLDRPFDIGHTLCFTSLYKYVRGEYRLAREEAAEAADVCEKFGFAVWLQCARAVEAIAMAKLGEREAGKAQLIATIARWKTLGCNTVLGFFTSELALIELELGRTQEALALAREGIELDIKLHNFCYLPGAHLTLAQVLARLPRPDLEGAEEAIKEGLSIARAQGSRAMEAALASELQELQTFRSEAVAGRCA